jgi:CheY-like chemotaxis protein
MKEQSKSILIELDNSENLRVISKMLAHEKCMIRVANNEEERIESVKSEFQSY